jgi:hypothetical protein
MFCKLFSVPGNVLLQTRYQTIQEKGLVDLNSFCTRTNMPWFELIYLYPIENIAQNYGFIAQAMQLRREIGSILGDQAYRRHFYAAPEDLHITLYCYTAGEITLPAEYKERKRQEALDLFSGELFVNPRPYIYGGCAADKAVILHGYDGGSLNSLRENIASLIDKTLPLNVYPNISHASLVRFLEPVNLTARKKINNLLANFDFGRIDLPRISYYEFSTYGVLSRGTEIAAKETIGGQ